MEPIGHLRLIAPEASARRLDERSDDELMLLAAASHQPAFACLVTRHQASVRAYCLRTCGSALGDDVAQEVFVALYRAAKDYVPDGRFRGYLFTIVARRCKNALRSLRSRKEDALPAERNPAATGTLEELLDAERRKRLARLIDKLPEAQRSAIQMRFGAELDYGEIACALGCLEPTARTRVHLGLAKLRALCGKAGDL